MRCAVLAARGSQTYKFGLDNPDAVAWLEESAFSRISAGIDETTYGALKGILTDGLEAKQSYTQIAGTIKSAFNDFGPRRAQLIATTEIGNAYSQGTLGGAKDLDDAGIETEKSWLTAGDDKVDDDCQENEDAGWIDIGDNFPSGVDAPLDHPGCRCALMVRTVKAGQPAAA